MKKVLAAFLIMIAGVVTVASAGDPWRHITRIFPSVQPLLYEDRFSCSTFLIDYERGIWLTAGHCVEYPGYRSIDGHAIEVIARSQTTDLAAVKAPRMARRALTLAANPAEVGETLAIVGYNQAGYDARQPQLRKIVLLFPPLTGINLLGQDVYEFGLPLLVTFSPVGMTMGMSGSPVLNRGFEVVGVHVAGFPGPVRGEIPLEDVKEFVVSLKSLK